MTGLFEDVAISSSAPKWNAAVRREQSISRRDFEIRSEFARDYTRILHCTAYRRLKHKTQVFFATTNDHVCTRIEHVGHVSSVSRTIATYLGLNVELVEAIALGHDLGHAPFGHEGEVAVKEILVKNGFAPDFFHEKNSLRFVDKIETLEDHHGVHGNMNLTYAVRDGIVCHCGEVDEHSLRPRDDVMDLHSISKSSAVMPFTWEGCVVKISDKIAYLGRDIEDAITLKILSPKKMEELNAIMTRNMGSKKGALNNTVLIHDFIADLCLNSNPGQGIRFSPAMFHLMREVKDFCYENIYRHSKLERYKKFVGCIIHGIYEILEQLVASFLEGHADDEVCVLYPGLCSDFREYLEKYVKHFGERKEYEHVKIYDLADERDRSMACIDFISGMTDQYAIKKYKEIIAF